MAITSPHLYVRSTDGSDASDGGTWADAKATVSGAAAIDTTTNKRIWVSDNHAESSATLQTWAFAGNAANPTWVTCVDDSTGEPPTTGGSVATTASITTTGANDIRVTGHVFFKGITFNIGTGANSAVLHLNQNSIDAIQVLEDCTINVYGTSFVSGVSMGSNTNLQAATVIFNNVSVNFVTAYSYFRVYNGSLKLENGSVSSSASLTNGLFFAAAGGRPAKIRASGVDISGIGDTAFIVAKGSDAVIDVVLRNCKLPAFTTGGLFTGTMASGDRIELYNCDSSDTNYRLWIVDNFGSITSDTSVYNDAGADDGSAQGFSWKMVSSANAEFPHQVLMSNEIVKWNDTTTGTLTATVEIVHESQGNGTSGALLDSEIWLEVMCLDPGGTPVGKWQSDRCGNLNLNSNAADQASSTATWTGDAAGWDAQKLVVSFTPKEKGYVHARVCLALASKTVYIDPLLTIA